MRTNPHARVDAITVSNEEGEMVFADGLTKREYFAAMALQGLIAGADSQNVIVGIANRKGMPSIRLCSLTAVQFADELIVALNGSEEVPKF